MVRGSTWLAAPVLSLRYVPCWGTVARDRLLVRAVRLGAAEELAPSEDVPFWDGADIASDNVMRDGGSGSSARAAPNFRAMNQPASGKPTLPGRRRGLDDPPCTSPSHQSTVSHSREPRADPHNLVTCLLQESHLNAQVLSHAAAGHWSQRPRPSRCAQLSVWTAADNRPKTIGATSAVVMLFT